MLELLARRWWLVLIRGIVAILMGIVAVLWSEITLVVLFFLFGAFVVSDGITAVWVGFTARSDGRVWTEMIAAGVIAIPFGVIAAVFPELTAITFVYVIAVFAIIRGVMEIAAAIQLRKVIDDEWMLVLAGVVSLLFGGILILRPGEGAIAMVLLIGAFMIAIGGMTVAFALRLRHVNQRLQNHRHPSSPA